MNDLILDGLPGHLFMIFRNTWNLRDVLVGLADCGGARGILNIQHMKESINKKSGALIFDSADEIRVFVLALLLAFTASSNARLTAAKGFFEGQTHQS